jgi:hypothetical protein
LTSDGESEGQKLQRYRLRKSEPWPINPERLRESSILPSSSPHSACIVPKFGQSARGSLWNDPPKQMWVCWGIRKTLPADAGKHEARNSQALVLGEAGDSVGIVWASNGSLRVSTNTLMSATIALYCDSSSCEARDIGFLRVVRDLDSFSFCLTLQWSQISGAI